MFVFMYSFLSLSSHALKSKITSSFMKKSSNTIHSRTNLHDRLEYLEYADSTQIKHQILPIKSQSWSNNNHNLLKRQILLVAIPSLAACIVEPALTMVDMYFIGTQSHVITATRGLAGLSVTGSLFNVIAAFTYPLCSGTTAIIARLGNQLQDNTETSIKQKSSILVNGYALSMIIGIIFTLLVSQYSYFIMKYVFNLDSTLLDLTASYLKIRSLSLPFTLLSYVSIGFCLAIQDVSTPMISIITSSFINIIGDYVLVSQLGLGLVGASIATAIATITSCLVSMVRIFDRYIHYDHTICIVDNLKVWYSYLDINRMKNFFQTSIPLLIGMVADTLTYSSGAKISSYIRNTSPCTNLISYSSYHTTATNACTIVASSVVSSTNMASITTANVATHQIAMQLWWFLSYFSSPISFAAQAILPKYYNDITNNNNNNNNFSNNNKENQLFAKHTIEKIIQIGGYVGLACTSILFLSLKVFPGLFTKDHLIQSMLQPIIPPVILSQFIICITTVIDGIFIGSNHIPQYAIASILSTTTAWIYYYFISIKNKLGVIGTWKGLLIFSMTRLLFYLSYILFNKIMNITTQK